MKKASLLLLAFIPLCIPALCALMYQSGYQGNPKLAALAALCGGALSLCFLGLVGLFIASLFRRKQRTATFGAMIVAILIFSLPAFTHFTARWNPAHGVRDRMMKDFGLEKLRLIARQIDSRPADSQENPFQNTYPFPPHTYTDDRQIVHIFWGSGMLGHWGALVSLNGSLPDKYGGSVFLRAAEDVAFFERN